MPDGSQMPSDEIQSRAMTSPIRTIICYHHADERCLGMLEAHLSSLEREHLIDIWHRGKVVPGDPIELVFQERLDGAELILLLVSADFNAQYDHRITASMRDEDNDQIRIVPIIARPCCWDGLPFFGLQPLPADGQPLMVSGQPAEERFVAAAKGLRHLVARVRERKQSPHKDLTTTRTVVAAHLTATLAAMECERHQLERQLLLGPADQGDIRLGIMRLRRTLASSTALRLDGSSDAQIVDLASDVILARVSTVPPHQASIAGATIPSFVSSPSPTTIDDRPSGQADYVSETGLEVSRDASPLEPVERHTSSVTTLEALLASEFLPACIATMLMLLAVAALTMWSVHVD